MTFSLKSVGVLAAICAVSLFSQSTGEITGTVTDSSGAVMLGAGITIRNTDTNQVRNATTNASGNYSVPYLAPGNYDVSAQSQGFKNVSNRGVLLQVGATVRIDFSLQLGEVAETVEVQGGASLLNTENAEVSTVIENRRIVELPLNGRNRWF